MSVIFFLWRVPGVRILAAKTPPAKRRETADLGAYYSGNYSGPSSVNAGCRRAIASAKTAIPFATSGSSVAVAGIA
jgi:hypothetical protein